MSRRGKKDEFKPVFDDATHDAFDSSDEYALAAMLRNYIAHNSEVIQGRFWGGQGAYDVGCSKDMLLSDSSFTEKKKEIIKRQPAQFISLTTIMAGVLEKLREIHKIFMDCDFSEDDVAAAEIVSEAILAIKDAGLDKWRFKFINSVKQPISTFGPDGRHIETVLATEYWDFKWQDYGAVLQYLLHEYKSSHLCAITVKTTIPRRNLPQ